MKLKILNLILLLTAFVMPLMVYPKLPEMIPMHWNIKGEVDSYQAKQTAVWMLPGIVLLMWGLFQVLPKLDPKREKYKQFWPEWQTLQTLLLGLFVYLDGVTLYIALNPGKEMTPLMFAGMGIMFAVMGNLLPKIRQNFFVGIKLPWTLADEENWNKTHRLGGWCFVAVGIMFLVQAIKAIFVPELLFAVMLLTIIIPVGYSGWLYKQKKSGKI
jgi:uncharacterized membrane protein